MVDTQRSVFALPSQRPSAAIVAAQVDHVRHALATLAQEVRHIRDTIVDHMGDVEVAALGETVDRLWSADSELTTAHTQLIRSASK